MSTAEAVQWLRERGKRTTGPALRKAMHRDGFGRKIGRSWVTNEAELRRWLGFEPIVIDAAHPSAIPTVTPFVARRERAS